MKPTVIRLAAVLLGLVGLMLCSGCTTVAVQPWERATLAEYSMRPDRDPLATMLGEHVYFSRESTGGGRGVGGGGCGCN